MFAIEKYVSPFFNLSALNAFKFQKKRLCDQLALMFETY